MRIKQRPEDFKVTEIPDRPWKKQGKLFVYKATKTDLTTLEMVDRIANAVKIRPSEIRFAGLKDKKAITTQYITSEAELTCNDPKIKLEHVGFTDEHLHLGSLKANHFEIVVKDVEFVRDAEVPNYYGDQRFSKNNVKIGMHILKKEFSQAAEILAQEYKEVKKQLSKDPKSPVTALRKAPFHVLLICVHSVQSYLWNEAVSAWVKDTFNHYEQADYTHGKLLFPKGKIPNGDVPIFGAASELGGWKKYYDPIAEGQGLTQESFIIRSIPKLTQEGAIRPIIPVIKDKQIDQEKKTATISFTLSPGSYATVCIAAWII